MNEQAIRYEVPQTDEPWEMPEEPAAPVVCIRELPENPTEEDRSRILDLYRHQAEALVPADETSEKAVLLFIDQCKESAKRLDKARKAKTDPLNDEIETITKPYRDAITEFKRLQGIVETKLNQYRIRRNNEIAAKQRQAIADAAKAKADQERIEREKREAAEAARAQGQEDTAVALEMQADEAAMTAATVVPEVIEQQKKTVDLGDAKMTVRTVRDWVFANGVPRGGSYYRKDPRFKDLPDEAWKLDEAQIGKLVRAGATIPGVVVFDKVSTVSKKG